MCSHPQGGYFTPPTTRAHRGLSPYHDDSLISQSGTISPELQAHTMSDTSHLRGWKSSRPVPQSVPSHAGFRNSQKGRMLGRAETVGTGLGGVVLEVAARPECSVCMDEFADEVLKVPRNLLCGHSYCTDCLDQLLHKSLDSLPSITCPKCCKVTDLAQRDITILPKNYSLLEMIRDSASSRSTSPAPFREKSPVPVALRCEEHGDSLSSFCTKCGELVCSSCLVYGKHRDHSNKTLFVSEAAIKYRQKLVDLIPEVRSTRGKMQSALEQIQRMSASVEEMGGQLEHEAEETYGQLVELIVAKRNALKLEIMERTQIRLEALTDQALDLKECIEKASSVERTADGLLRGDDYSLLQKATLTMDQIEGIFVNPPQATPKAQNDLRCEFSDKPAEEIAAQVAVYGIVRPDVGIISHLFVKAYHDGFSIKWDSHNFTDNEGTTYYLQKAWGREEDFTPLCRGSSTKYNYKDDLKHGQSYRFRVQVRTPEGVGNWSEPVEAVKAAPEFHWHESWRNVKVELCRNRLEAAWTKGGAHNFWATFAGDKLFLKGKHTFAEKHYFEIEILDLGKSKSLKKLALGVISCRKSSANSLPWQDGKNPIGQWDTPSWSFQPMLGVVHSQGTSAEGVQYSKESSLTVGDRVGMLVELDEGRISYFLNGRDLGAAFVELDEESVLPCVSIRDKVRVLLRFPPPPYQHRKIKLTKLSSRGQAQIY